MSTRSLVSFAGRALVGGACLLASASCGSEMLRTGRAPVYLVVESVVATAGGEGAEPSAFLNSDVDPVFNDTVEVQIRSVLKNGNLDISQIQTVTLTRYHVEFRRTDGRNTPGSDVSYGFDGGLAVSITPGESGTAVLSLVRHQAKLEPPLLNLRGLGGQAIISAIAEITFYGRDQNGNEVSVAARVDVTFADFANAA